jgi:hypothetical protein
MKKLIVLLITLVAMPAFAGTKAYTKNGEGGQIVLTDERCEADPEMLRAYFFTESHYTEEGCWKDDDTTIFAKWDQQGKYRYRKSIFKVVNQW